MYRRTGWNFSLERAVEWARSLDRPSCDSRSFTLRLSVGERSPAPLHSRRHGGQRARVRAHERALLSICRTGKQEAAKHLLATLAARACVVVTDDFPCFDVAAHGRGGGAADWRSCSKWSTRMVCCRCVPRNKFTHAHSTSGVSCSGRYPLTLLLSRNLVSALGVSRSPAPRETAG